MEHYYLGLKLRHISTRHPLLLHDSKYILFQVENILPKGSLPPIGPVPWLVSFLAQADGLDLSRKNKQIAMSTLSFTGHFDIRRIHWCIFNLSVFTLGLCHPHDVVKVR